MQHEDSHTHSHTPRENYHAFLMGLPIPVMVMEADRTISFINPAFEKTFGWTLEEIIGRPLDFIPEDQIQKTATGKARLITTGELENFETKRFTKDGRLLDVIYDGARYYDAYNRPAGLVISLRDVTQTKRAEFINQVLFRISNALHRFRSLDDLLTYISRQICILLESDRAHVILLDEKNDTFYFRADAVETTTSADKYAELRIPAHAGVMGEVRRTRKPIIVNDYANSSLAVEGPNHLPQLDARNLVQVPIFAENKLIGVLCVVNKRGRGFDHKDVDLLSAIAGVVALPIENARINSELFSSYQEIKSLNRAKDSILDRLSHELRTPLSVIRASLHMLASQPADAKNEKSAGILERAEKNLNRLLGMQYQLEDIAQHADPSPYGMLSQLLDMSIEDLENMMFLENGNPDNHGIRQKFDSIFGPRTADPQLIELGPFVSRVLSKTKPVFAHRQLHLTADLQETGTINMTPEVLEKIIVGLVKNAVENTPDGGKIEVQVKRDNERVLLNICDSGVGITEENKQLIFKNYFTARETRSYSTRKPYDFNAGGSGLDLLRIKIFSERHHFKINMTSSRCPYIPTDEDVCPGSISECRFLTDADECWGNSGTIFSIEFPANPVNS